MTPAQCRAARALLGITQPELAATAGLGLSTIVDFEKGRRRVSDDAIKAIQQALERAGIAFTETGAEIAFEESRTAAYVGFRSVLAEPANLFGNLTHVGKNVSFLSGAQIRAARALLRWSAEDLARGAALGVNTIRRAELAEDGTSLTAANQLAIRRALETAGVVFIDENSEAGRGVRLRKR
jgi:transcriptional regulator with XRE-family HTH domain